MRKNRSRKNGSSKKENNANTPTERSDKSLKQTKIRKEDKSVETSNRYEILSGLEEKEKEIERRKELEKDTKYDSILKTTDNKRNDKMESKLTDNKNVRFYQVVMAKTNDGNINHMQLKENRCKLTKTTRNKTREQDERLREPE